MLCQMSIQYEFLAQLNEEVSIRNPKKSSIDSSLSNVIYLAVQMPAKVSAFMQQEDCCTSIVAALERRKGKNVRTWHI